MLEITAIGSGIVIDHIKAGQGIKIFRTLKLDQADFAVALITNASSEKMGRKDIIKIEKTIDLDLDLLGLFGQEITANIIQNEEIIDKKTIQLPQTITSVLTCKNPRCISNHERQVTSRFDRVEEASNQYICHYCDQPYEWEDA
ncbi:aspartate carbamoyltransferase regulatory subunit [Aerococcus kribbianus]|uniref:Aspartate carbamoyltransferase regulatory subunit n=1 Tax=Aerococcus kribbianus TaxID=2999064 RepID=A0A9X3FP88_9LACT|nr:MULTISPECIES: aspartate carbamoyltransferase regulatory subunit [unclassified Aerococcus]MCZ0717151.1 aspartate carbamoyltransferase regulatory subunit [Aerococcus sp. YH-aer221]MCZ0725439.1 aspartate carbamoyltransferase regulatory subunit [Aerococcus sp. YH-aer222]